MKQKKISYVSLGCAKNQVDFEYLIGELSADGFISETDPSKCDAVIINTCGFIEPAVKEAVDKASDGDLDDIRKIISKTKHI